MHQMNMKTDMSTGDDRGMKNERHHRHHGGYQFLKNSLVGGREKSKKITVRIEDFVQAFISFVFVTLGTLYLYLKFSERTSAWQKRVNY